ncbi:MAG: hypothetical protein RIM99_04225 [Cyclobacteriaceae bacterium]
MKKLLIGIIAGIIIISVQAQEFKERPTVQELDFIIGKWEITFDWYDTHQPGSSPCFTEKGWQICEYDMDLNGTPMYIICKGELEIDSGKYLGRKREILEAIRYSRFEKSFERVGIYSNWPATGLELLTYDSAQAQFTIRGQLNVQNNMLERYIDVYKFSKDHSYFDRTNIANFSDMPLTEYNLTLRGTGRKIKNP